MVFAYFLVKQRDVEAVSYTHLDVYKRQRVSVLAKRPKTERTISLQE